MRISALGALALATMALAIMAAMMPRPAAAAYNLPWCAYYYDSDARSCAFTSYAQCMATISGVGGHCTQNLLYPPPPPPPHAERHRVKHRVSGDH